MIPEPGQIVAGKLFSEPMRVETAAQIGDGTWRLGLVGTHTERFRSVTLSAADLASLTTYRTTHSFQGDGALFRLGVQAYSLGIAFEFDPYFGLSVSRVDPLPHQLEAIYHYMLKLPRVRFLLADDAGAGKTIMAGLLLRELKLRGLVERALIVCPANLTFQWQRELKEKFDEQFLVMRGYDLRVQYGVNQWLEHPQIITSLDLAKRDDILPSLRQARWDFVVVDEAHRMSAAAEDKKSLRYRLGELLRDTTDHCILLTATPHKGDPLNFSLFLRLLDEDAFADVRSIREAMEHRRAPFYLRRLKEAMVYFPEQQTDGSWVAKKIFTKRIPHSINFRIDGAEFDLYREVTRFVKSQSARAAAREDDPRARAVGFLMTLYQRRLASSTFAVQRSLENRARRLELALKRGQQLLAEVVEIPDPEDLEEMDDAEREKWEERLALMSLARNPQELRDEIEDLLRLAKMAEEVEASGAEAKLSKLRTVLQEQGFFDRPDQRLLIFTEFKDTLDYLVERLRGWGFQVGFIHGSMKPGSREEAGTRLWAEQQFKDGKFQVLVATEAAGEGINLQFCHILFNYDIPWNPNRLERLCSGLIITARIVAALKAEGLLNESVGAGYLERNWPIALKESGMWPLKGCRQSFLDGSLTRLLDPEDVLRKQVVAFVEKGDFGLGSGPKPEGGFERVWWKESIGPEEVTFDDKTFLLTRARAGALKAPASQAASTPTTPAGLAPELILEPPPSAPRDREPSTPEQEIRLTLHGAIPPEQWNKLGTRLIPRLRSAGHDLSLNLEAGVTVGPQDVSHIEAELRQAVRDLGLEGLVRIEKKPV